jgi:hypothetical protein
MALLASIVAMLALAAAAVSWAAGGRRYSRAPRMQTADAVGGLPCAVPAWRPHAWPLALRTIGDAACRAGVSKALVACLTFLMLAMAATSVATNLARVSRQSLLG